MEQRVQPLRIDPARLHGLSERLVSSHHQNNYAGAVRRLNAIRAQLAALDFGAAPGFQLNGLKREELVATNSMLLHELHFACLGGNGRDMAPAMALALAANFGSAERWREEFVAMGKALAGGSGWVLLSFSPVDGTLVNQWASDHTQAIAGAVPILALDMYEHAYHLDFGAKADAWVDAFMRNIHWEGVYDRYRLAVTAASEQFGVARSELPAGALLDVRRAGVFEQDQQLIPGATWADPAAVGQWGPSLPPDREVVVYCVYGHEVGRSTALRLRAQGLQAWFLRGGIDGWKAAGMPLADKASSVRPPAPAASPGRS